MPPTLGQRLKHAREKRGLTLRDVEHSTRIPVGKLQDLEDDRLNTFGGMTYAKSFLKAYAKMMEVNAEEVLEQMKPPPLGGVRDYRYLVESQGPWITDRRDHYSGAPVSSLGPGKPFLIVVMTCFAFGLLIGGGVLANAYFHPKPTVTTTPPIPKAEPVLEGAYVTADPVLQSPAQEFEIREVNVTLAAEEKKPALPVTVPKAQPVDEPPVTKRHIVPPKAEPVR